MLYSAAVSAYDCDYGGSQRQMNACAIRDYKQADEFLNTAYKNAMSGLSPAKKQILRHQQREWIKKRDARCAPKKKGEGTNVTIDYLSCMEMYTEIRTLQLLGIKTL